MSCTGRAFTRAAASSMASGMPSSRQQISATAAAFSCVKTKPGSTARARCRNRATPVTFERASNDGSGSMQGRSSGGTGNSCSPGRRRVSRLVTRTAKPGASANKSPMRGSCRDHMLEVVEQEKHSPVVEKGANTVEHRQPCCLGEPQRSGESTGDHGGVTDRRQRDEAHAISVLALQVIGSLDGQARLADSAGAGQGQKASGMRADHRGGAGATVPSRCQEPHDLGDLAFSPDET